MDTVISLWGIAASKCLSVNGLVLVVEPVVVGVACVLSKSFIVLYKIKMKFHNKCKKLYEKDQ